MRTGTGHPHTKYENKLFRKNYLIKVSRCGRLFLIAAAVGCVNFRIFFISLTHNTHKSPFDIK